MDSAATERNEDDLLRQAELLARGQDEGQALRLLAVASTRYPHSVRVPVWTGLVLEQIGKRADARAAYALAVDGRTPLPGQSGDLDHYCRFLALLRLGRFRDAGQLDRERGEDGAWNLILHEPSSLGGPISILPAGFHEEQLDELGRVKTAEDVPWALFYRVLFLRALGRVEEALESSAELARLPTKRFGWMRYMAGAIFLRAGRYRHAERELRAALSSERPPWHVFCLLAETLMCLGREDAALRLLGRLDGGAAAGDALAWHGELLLWTGRYSEARHILSRAARSNGRFAPVWLAAACLLDNDLAASQKLFDAMPAHRLDAEALTWRSELALRQGRLDAARRDADAALAATPGMYWASLLLTRLDLRASPRLVPASPWQGLPPAIGRFNLRRVGRRWDAKRAGLAIDEVFSRARGLRRPDSYLLPLLNRALAGRPRPRKP